jgi:cell division protein FtsN
MALLVLVLGVSGAVYFERNEAPLLANNEPAQTQVQPQAAATAEAQPAQAAAPAENKPQEQASVSPESNPTTAPPSAPQAAPAPTSPPAPAVPAPSQTLPQTQAANPPLSPDSEAQRLAQIAPSAAPANVASAVPRYWVEFGAYEGALYADRLKQSLDRLGIDATIANAPGKDGRRYLRVRTSGDSDHSTAAAQLAKAQSALHIAPLLHRATAISPAPTRPPEAKAAPAAGGAYWVQFGAFRERRNAEQVLSQLRKNDIQASVIEQKNGGLKPLYLIRASSLSDQAQAEQIAQHGSAALRSHDVLIGESPVAGLHPRPPPR